MMHIKHSGGIYDLDENTRQGMFAILKILQKYATLQSSNGGVYYILTYMYYAYAARI